MIPFPLPASAVPWLALGALLLAAAGLVVALGARSAVVRVRERISYVSRPSEPRREIPLPRPDRDSASTAALVALERRVMDLEAALHGQDRRIASVEAMHSADAPASPPMQAAAAQMGTGIGQPVDFDGQLLRPSRSLAALGMLHQGGSGGPATLSLNPAVEVDHLAFDLWSALFDFTPARPYLRYRTLTPAEVQWDAVAGTGQLLRRGAAEAIQ
jgi:hypothetical protein